MIIIVLFAKVINRQSTGASVLRCFACMHPTAKAQRVHWKRSGAVACVAPEDNVIPSIQLLFITIISNSVNTNYVVHSRNWCNDVSKNRFKFLVRRCWIQLRFRCIIQMPIKDIRRWHRIRNHVNARVSLSEFYWTSHSILQEKNKL